MLFVEVRCLHEPLDSHCSLGNPLKHSLHWTVEIQMSFCQFLAFLLVSMMANSQMWILSTAENVPEVEEKMKEDPVAESRQENSRRWRRRGRRWKKKYCPWKLSGSSISDPYTIFGLPAALCAPLPAHSNQQLSVSPVLALLKRVCGFLAPDYVLILTLDFK